MSFNWRSQQGVLREHRGLERDCEARCGGPQQHVSADQVKSKARNAHRIFGEEIGTGHCHRRLFPVDARGRYQDSRCRACGIAREAIIG